MSPVQDRKLQQRACMCRRVFTRSVRHYMAELFSQGATRGSLTGDTSDAWSGTMLTVSAHLHISTLRFDSAILLPFGNSRNRRTNVPALSTTYLVPVGNRFGRRAVT